MYILIEYVDNGHPINHSYVGIDCHDFHEAKEIIKRKVKESIKQAEFRLTITKDTKDEFMYRIDGWFLPIIGTLQNLEILKNE